MASRKQFETTMLPDPQLETLFERARARGVSEEELREQRISFAFGNAPPSEGITKDSVRASSKRFRL